ncbi:DUF7882 family protein [Microbacterium proteolyticum]|uniref:DUF7882 family protein n=1 Tax=Microbacterium proteolyticum TaxID=1572644 RepID=UPI001FADFA02|nr:hypothetical protein [Microbacterium proteolyticum]MCI9859142.1 hypothetical protein [Microbacterium proteolyticum]
MPQTMVTCRIGMSNGVKMGSLFYGSMAEPIRLPDIVLAHLQAVTTARLRRGESFIVSCRLPDAAAGHRSTLWMHAAIPLRFVFDVDAEITLNGETLRHFAQAAQSTAGILIDVTEPDRRDGSALPAAARSVA